MLSDSRGPTPSSPSSPPYPDYHPHHHHHHHHHGGGGGAGASYPQHGGGGGGYKPHASPPSSPSSGSSTSRCCSLRGGRGCCGPPPPPPSRRGGRRAAAWCCCCYCPAAVANSAFSSVGVCLLVLAYTLLGAFVFWTVENGIAGNSTAPATAPSTAKATSTTATKIGDRGGVFASDIRARTVEKLWSITEDLNILYRENWTKLATQEVLKFQEELVRNVRRYGGGPALIKKAGDGGAVYYGHLHHRWSFSSSFLYSLTLITTIGYGSVTPRTPWGKVITIVYALIGIPLMLVYLSTVGDVLARNFRRLYARMCGGGAVRGKAAAASAKSKLSGSAERYLSTGYTPAAATKGHNNILAADGSAVKVHHYHAHAAEGGAGAEELQGKLGRSASMAVLDCGGGGGEALGASSTSSLDPTGKYRRHHDGAPAGCADPVRIPISLCLLIVILYICGGALLFHWLEHWTFLEGSFFCFTSLGTIGFGDLIPGLAHSYELQHQTVAAAAVAEQISVFASSAYILVGMALIAMCFNLVQDEVVIVVRKMGQYFGVNCGGGGAAGGVGGGGGRGGGDDDEDLMLEVLDGEGIAMSVVSTTGGSSS